MLLAQTLEARAMPLIVLPVSALLLLWAWAGAYVLLNPSSVDPAFRSAGLPMLLLFGGLFLASLVTLFNYRIRVIRMGERFCSRMEGALPMDQMSWICLSSIGSSG